MLLSDILAEVIREHQQHINDLADGHADQPLEITLNWHPIQRKVDCVVRVVDHLPPYRVERERARAAILGVTVEAAGLVVN